MSCGGGGEEASQGIGVCSVECSRAEEQIAHVHEETVQIGDGGEGGRGEGFQRGFLGGEDGGKAGESSDRGLSENLEVSC